MKKILDWQYNRFGITQLDENEVKRLVSCMEEKALNAVNTTSPLQLP